MQTDTAFHFLLRRPFAIMALALVLFLSMAHDVAGLTIDADRQYGFAQSRFEADAYSQAIIEFNRFIHFFPSDPRIPRAWFLTGMAHYRMGDYQAAAAVFNRLTDNYQGSPIQNKAFFMLSRSHARQGMIEQAMLDLHNLLAVASNKDVIDRARYELGWLHVDQGRWQQADETFGAITPANQDRLKVSSLKETLSRSGEIPTKNPTTAGVLSIVPGGGQLYTGRYQDALTAFLINAGLIWAAWESFDEDLIGLGSVIAFVGVGFYAGNIYGAISSAHKYNRDRVSEFKNHLNRHRLMPLAVAPVSGGAALSLSIDF
jgi:tetratricopeptide (TPR) repeat protein